MYVVVQLFVSLIVHEIISQIPPTTTRSTHTQHNTTEVGSRAGLQIQTNQNKRGQQQQDRPVLRGAKNGYLVARTLIYNTSGMVGRWVRYTIGWQMHYRGCLIEIVKKRSKTLEICKAFTESFSSGNYGKMAQQSNKLSLPI